MIPIKGSAPSWRRWVISAAVFVVLVVIAAIVGGSRSQPQRSGLFKARTQDLPVAPGQDSPEGDRLYHGVAVGPPPAIPEPVTLDEFVATLEKTVPAPVAKKVVAEFKNDKVLNLAAETFRKKRGGKASAREFVDFITRIPQFRQLMARFKSDPGFKASYSAAMKNPEIGGVVRSGTLGVAAGQGRGKSIKGGSGAQAVDAEAIAREWQRKALSGLDLTQIRSLGIGSTSLPSNMLAAAGISPIAIGGGVPATAGDVRAVTANLASGQSAHDVTKMKDVKSITYSSKTADNSSWSSNDWIKNLLLAIGKGAAQKIRDYMEKCAESSGSCNVWGACYATGNYEACVAQCGKTVEKCPPSYKNPFWGCENQISYTQVGCIVDCLDGKYGCQQGQIDKSQWNQACLEPSLLQSQCLTAQQWGPCTGDPKVCVSGGLDGKPKTTVAGGAVDTKKVVAAASDTGKGGLDPAAAAPASCNADCVMDLINKALADAKALSDQQAAQIKKLEADNAALQKIIEDMKAGGEDGDKKGVGDDTIAGDDDKKVADDDKKAADEEKKPGPVEKALRDAGEWLGDKIDGVIPGAKEKLGDAGAWVGEKIDNAVAAVKNVVKNCRPRWGVPPWSCDNG